MRSFWDQFKTLIVGILLFFVALAAYTTLFGPISFRVNNVNTNQTDIFSASGEGEAAAVPDEATIYVGVSKNAATVAEAQKQANTVANKLISDLKALGIKDKDIKTTNYSVNPDYEVSPLAPRLGEPINGQNRQEAYRVTENIEVKVKPIENVNKVIDLATKDGANLIGGVNFTFSEGLKMSLEEKATKQAVEKAKEKAQTLAGAAGVRLGRIINVVSSTNNPPIYSLGAERKAGDLAEPTTEVTPGENTVQIGVTIYYETY